MFRDIGSNSCCSCWGGFDMVVGVGGLKQKVSLNLGDSTVGQQELEKDTHKKRAKALWS